MVDSSLKTGTMSRFSWFLGNRDRYHILFGSQLHCLCWVQFGVKKGQILRQWHAGVSSWAVLDGLGDTVRAAGQTYSCKTSCQWVYIRLREQTHIVRESLIVNSILKGTVLFYLLDVLRAVVAFWLRFRAIHIGVSEIWRRCARLCGTG